MTDQEHILQLQAQLAKAHMKNDRLVTDMEVVDYDLKDAREFVRYLQRNSNTTGDEAKKVHFRTENKLEFWGMNRSGY